MSDQLAKIAQLSATIRQAAVYAQKHGVDRAYKKMEDELVLIERTVAALRVQLASAKME